MDALLVLVALASLSAAVAEFASHLPAELGGVLSRARKEEAQ
jgi:hypothetical protein